MTTTASVSEQMLDEVPIEDEDLKALLTEIANGLSSLSSSEVIPKGWGKKATPFSIEDVDFTSNGWLLRVNAISPWLHLDENLPNPSEHPEDFLRNLFTQLRHPSDVPCFETTHGIFTLTSTGKSVFLSRLDTAIRQRDQFADDLEAEISAKEASAAWEERWEEQSQQDEPLGPIHASVDTFKISNFRELAVAKTLSLNPTYQRGDVWSTADSQKLIASIVRGIPLPSIIILKADAGKRYEIVDGKQRLTAILRFMGQHPTALELVQTVDNNLDLNGELQKAFNKDYNGLFRRMWKAHAKEELTSAREADLYFPFRLPSKDKLPTELKRIGGKYYCDAKHYEFKVASEPTSLQELFDGPSPPYVIPVIVYKETKAEQIHIVFNLYNKQGKHLNAEEIRNAIFHDVALTRLLLATAGDNPNLEKLAPYVLGETQGQMRNIAAALAKYKFGSSRYKRTKVLSWLSAILLEPSVDSNGAFTVRSTATHINLLFEHLRRSDHPLRAEAALLKLLDALHRGIQAHSQSSWPALFKDNDEGTKWQELQLVASLTGTILLGMIHADPVEVLESYAPAVAAFLNTNGRPGTVQNKHQWHYIGRIALGLLEICGADLVKMEARLTSAFGINCLVTLSAARDMKVKD